jgi:hypothetical protein
MRWLEKIHISPVSCVQFLNPISGQTYLGRWRGRSRSTEPWSSCPNASEQKGARNIPAHGPTAQLPNCPVHKPRVYVSPPATRSCSYSYQSRSRKKKKEARKASPPPWPGLLRELNFYLPNRSAILAASITSHRRPISKRSIASAAIHPNQPQIKEWSIGAS